MKLLKQILLVAAFTAAAVSTINAQAVPATLFFDSSLVGRYDGATATVSTTNGSSITAAYFQNISGHNEAIFFVNGNDLTLTIGLPLGEDFVTGRTYQTQPIPYDPSSDAGYKVQFGISAIPGSYSDSHSADVSGWFKVLDYSAVTGASHLTSLAVDYYQIDADGNWNYGSLRYNSSIPINSTYDVGQGYAGSAIPEPSTYAAFAGLAVLVIAFVRQRKLAHTT